MESMTLHTERLLLETLTPAAVPLKLVAWLNDPAVNRYLESRFVTHTMETQQAYAAAQHPPSYYMAIRANGESGLTGTVKLEVDDNHKVGSLGYLIGPQYAGRGYATEAVKAVTEWALTDLGLRYVEVSFYGGHDASRRVALKAGYHRTEHGIPERYLLDGEPEFKSVYRREA